MPVHRNDDPYVYFVRRQDGEGPVKIGCSEAPERRLQALMCWAPYPLALIATIPGDEELEHRFHNRFAAQHSHREWFHPSLELTQTIVAIRAGVFDIDTLPEGRRLYGTIRKPWTELQKRNARAGRALDRLVAAKMPVPEEIREIRYGIWRLSAAKQHVRLTEIEAFLATQPETRKGRKKAA